MELRQVKKGEFFYVVRNGVIGTKIYIKGEYDRAEKKFLCTDYFDAGSEGKYFKPSHQVEVDFEF